nr:hypothetical protein [Campylobacter sp. LR264d]
MLDTIIAEFNKENITKEYIYFEKSQIDFATNQIKKEKIEISHKDYTTSLDKTIQTNLLDFADKNKIPLHFVLEMFNKLDKDKFYNSPKTAFESLKKIYEDIIHRYLVSVVSYEFGEHTFSNDDLFMINLAIKTKYS